MTHQPTEAPEGRNLRRDSSALMVGSVTNGLLAYVFVVMGTRSLGAEAFAAVAVLWGFWAFSGAALAFPIQHWVIRQMEIDRGPSGVAAALPRLALAALGVALGEGLVGVLFGARLFGSTSWLWPAAVFVLALGTAVLGLVRGLLAGRGRFGSAAAVIGGENLVRVVAAAVMIAVWREPEGFAAALLCGPLIALGWSSVARDLMGPKGAPPRIRLAGASGLGSVLSQTILHGGPVILAAIGGSPVEVTILFSTLALFRAPYLIGIGLTLRSTGPVSRMVIAGDYRGIARLGALIAALAAVLAGLAAVVGAFIGPGAVALVFGESTRPESWVAAVVAAASVLAIAGLWQFVGLIASGRERALVTSWLAAIVAAALTIVLVPGEASSRVVVAFVVGEAVAAAAMALALISWARQTKRYNEPCGLR